MSHCVSTSGNIAPRRSGASLWTAPDPQMALHDLGRRTTAGARGPCGRRLDSVLATASRLPRRRYAPSVKPSVLTHMEHSERRIGRASSYCWYHCRRRPASGWRGPLTARIVAGTGAAVVSWLTSCCVSGREDAAPGLPSRQPAPGTQTAGARRSA